MFLSRAVDVLEPLHLGLPPVGLLPVALLSNARTSALGNHLINRPQWRQLARSACGPVPGLSTGVSQVPQWGQGRKPRQHIRYLSGYFRRLCLG